MIFLEQVCSTLEKGGIKYAIVGGHAVALHGAVRGTIDIDIALTWTKETLQKAVEAIQSLGLESRLPLTVEDVFTYREEYIKNRNLIAWSFYNPQDLSEQLDLIINYDLKRKSTKCVSVGKTNIHILGKKELIAMKRASSRPQDIEDINALEQLP